MRTATLSLATIALLFGCKKPAVDVAVGSGSGSGSSAGSGSAVAGAGSAVATWKFESKPVELLCGGDPLALPKPVAPIEPPVETTLEHRAPITTCQNQVSAAATCTCLVASVGAWAKDLSLSPTVECDPKPTVLDANAQIVRLESVPDDRKATTGGEARVLVVKRGATWSALDVIGSAADIDRTETPHASEIITIDRTEVKPIEGGTLYWIETRDASEDKSVGDLDQSGNVTGMVCQVTTKQAECRGAVTLATWQYAFTPVKGTCEIRSVMTLGATITPIGVTAALVHGKQSKAFVGTYRYGSMTGSAGDTASGSGRVGSAGSGSAIAAGQGSAAETSFTNTDLCLMVVKKVRECLATPAFIAALDEGATARQKRLNAKLRRQTKAAWPYDARDVCHTYFEEFTFEHPGFLDHAAKLDDDSLTSCAVLGAAIKNAGGLVGGQTAN
jgi:hypothetical protein